MYDTFHSERFKSPDIHGVTLIAQLSRDKLVFSAELTHPVPTEYGQNSFGMDQDEWESGRRPYVIDLAPVYMKTFGTSQARAWREQIVPPWERQQRKAYLHNHIDAYQKRIQEMREALQDLDTDELME